MKKIIRYRVIGTIIVNGKFEYIDTITTNPKELLDKYEFLVYKIFERKDRR